MMGKTQLGGLNHGLRRFAYLWGNGGAGGGGTQINRRRWQHGGTNEGGGELGAASRARGREINVAERWTGAA